ncbi:MAG: Jag N-terminal domain-containing protein [Candidatus Hydrogenedentes bacterium]|nr:Jag N-terminal domain-containing protein [Candidatus Hydrogenedentota bacterium]
MRSVEVSAKTREEAIKIALEQLDIDRDEAHVEIVDEGSNGIFGFGARPVKLRVSTEVAGPAPKEPRGKAPVSQKLAPRDHRDKAPAPIREKTPPPARDRQPAPAREKAAPAPARPAAPARTAAPVLRPSSDGEAAALLKEVIHQMGIEATVTSFSTEDGGTCLKVDSPDSAILIGRKGRNLSSMQYLINRMVHHGEGDESERIVIDIEGYLDRRQEALEDLARRLAQKAKETRRRVRVKPMSSQERRVIHMTLEDDPDVKTFSVGDALVRSVIIAPKDEIEEEEGRPSHRRGGSRRGGRGREREQEQAGASPNGGNRQPQQQRDARGGSSRGGRRRGRRRPGGQQRTGEKAMAPSDASSGVSHDE